jgi:hypothetical protein
VKLSIGSTRNFAALSAAVAPSGSLCALIARMTSAAASAGTRLQPHTEWFWRGVGAN